MKVYSPLLLLLAIVAGCASRETQQIEQPADSVQAPVTEAPAPQQPVAATPASESYTELETETPEKKRALKMLDSLELSIDESNIVPSSVKILTDRLLDATGPTGTDTLLVTMLTSTVYPFVGYAGFGEGDVFVYRLSVFKKDEGDLTLITHEDFEQGGGNIKTESRFYLLEMAKGRYAIAELSRSEGFNGTGTSDYTIHTLYALNKGEFVSIFSVMASELFEGATDNSSADRTEVRTLKLLSSVTNGLFDIQVSEQKDKDSDASTEKTYTWRGEKYDLR